MRGATIHSRQDRAFSLAEIVIVLVILAVLAAAGIPRYANSLASYRVQQAAARVAADLMLAQVSARTSSVSQSISFSTSSSSYSIAGAQDFAAMANAYSVNLSSAPYHATLVSASFGGGGQVTFDRYGQPSSGGTVVVQVGTMQKTIALDANSGKATWQ